MVHFYTHWSNEQHILQLYLSLVSMKAPGLSLQDPKSKFTGPAYVCSEHKSLIHTISSFITCKHDYSFVPPYCYNIPLIVMTLIITFLWSAGMTAKAMIIWVASELQGPWMMSGSCTLVNPLVKLNTSAVFLRTLLLSPVLECLDWTFLDNCFPFFGEMGICLHN